MFHSLHICLHHLLGSCDDELHDQLPLKMQLGDRSYHKVLINKLNIVTTECMHLNIDLYYIMFTILSGVKNSRENTFQLNVVNKH